MTQVGELVTPTGVLVLPHDAPRADWLKARRMRDDVPGRYCIGSSDVPSILDLDGVDTPVYVFRDKVHGVEKSVTEAMELGQELEPVIALRWQRVNKCATHEIGLVAHRDKPWHQSTTDRGVDGCPLGLPGRCICEIKNVGYSTAERWGREIPDRLLAQMLHQLYVTGYGHAHYACLVGGNMLKQGVVYADRERDLMEFIVAEVDRFRENHLLTGVEPPWTDSKTEKLIALDKHSHPIRAGEASVEDLGWLLEYAQRQAEESRAKKLKRDAQAQMARIADGAQMVLFGDEPAWSYRESETERADLDRLKAKYPHVYDDPEIVKRTKTYTLVVDRAYKVRLKDEETEMAKDKHEGHAMGRGIAKGTTAKTDRAAEPKRDVPKGVEGHALGRGPNRRTER